MRASLAGGLLVPIACPPVTVISTGTRTTPARLVTSVSSLPNGLPQRVATRTAGHRYKDGTGHTVASLAIMQ